VSRSGYRLHTEVTPAPGAPIVLMHGLPDNVHPYDRLLPYLAGRRPVVRFDFLGWGRSDKAGGAPLHRRQPGRRPGGGRPRDGRPRRHGPARPRGARRVGHILAN